MESGEAIRVRLPVFEVPLDLLLFLIRKHELDILEISLATIADEFVTFVRVSVTGASTSKIICVA